jgi:glutamate-1-semialdehyde 2,1-aminomutase
MTAIRLARAATGRQKVLSFEGCYHGHSDGLLVKRGSGLATLGLAGSAGVPPIIAQETLVIPFNDGAALDAAVAQFGDELACAIVEPVPANMGVVPPQPGFLQRLRELTTARGIVLIFDEVVTGFRLAYGGAQARVGVRPDLTVLGKIIGGGLPIGAVGGPARLMDRLAPEGDVYHAGTFAGHPLAMAAGLATLQTLRRERPYARLEALGARLADGLAAMLQPPVQINRVGSMLTVYFSERPVRSFADTQSADTARFAALANAWRDAGVLVPPSPFEAMFLSTAHTAAHVDAILRTARGVS